MINNIVLRNIHFLFYVHQYLVFKIDFDDEAVRLKQITRVSYMSTIMYFIKKICLNKYDFCVLFSFTCIVIITL